MNDIEELERKAVDHLRLNRQQPTPEAIVQLIRRWRDDGSEDKILCSQYLLAQ